MTTAEHEAAARRGREAALAAMAGVEPPTTVSVTLDRGGGLDGREHIAWCLTCQRPHPERCTCGNPGDGLVEDSIDAMSDVAALIAESRERLAFYADAAAGMVDVEVKGERL